MTASNGSGSTAAPARDGIFVSLVQTIASIGVIQVASMCFLLVRSKVVAVTLGPEGVGAISLIDQVVGLVAQVCTFSLPFAAIKFLSAAHSEGQQSFANLYATLLRALLIVSLAGTASGIALLIWWPAVLGDELVRYAGIVTLALLSIPATNLVALSTNTMAAARRVHAAAAYGAYNAAALAVLCTAGVFVAGLFGYYLGNLIALAILALGGLLYLKGRERLSIFGNKLSLWREIRRRPEVIGFSVSLYLISFSMPIAYLIARYAVLNSQGLEGAGLLQSAMALSLALTTVMRQANLLYLTPAMNRVGEAEEKCRAAAEFLRAFSLVIGMVAVPLVLFPDWWLPLLYSRRFLDASPYVYLFVLAQTVELLAGVVLAVLVGLGHIGTQVWVTLIGLAGLAVIAWALAPLFGIAGVALAILFDGLVVFALAAWRLWRLHRFSIAPAMGWLPAGMVLLIASCGIFAVLFPSDTLGLILTKGVICLLPGFIGLTILRDKDGRFARWNQERT
jgi:O-antigen/teichoic acid export membrane protein